jgi:hypothetical protein
MLHNNDFHLDQFDATGDIFPAGRNGPNKQRLLYGTIHGHWEAY